MNDTGSNLATIDNGKVPECRMSDAGSVQDFVQRLVQNDERRSRKRSLVNGIVDGNAPYRRKNLLAAGRAEATNVNWNVSKAYCDGANGAFYDLLSEAPGFMFIKTAHGEQDDRDDWSRIMSEEADRILSRDEVWDYEMQLSQWDMVLHGCGPLMFEDSHCILPRAFQCGELKVPERTKSDTKYWEAGAIVTDYYPPQLYRFIENEKAATAVGWDVPYVKEVIQNAINIRRETGTPYNWEFYQQELKNNSFSYYDDTKVCRLAHVFWSEFDGRITHTIVLRESQTDSAVKFLFKSVGRYSCWQEAIHPMYYDRGNGGFHHSVTGLGVKMYGAMEFQNRLICNLADKAFAPKILFKPTTTESSAKFSIQTLGDMAVIARGFDWEQTGVAGLTQEGIMMNREITELVRNNLASYREGPMKQQGNPVTARQVMYDASQQSSLSKTQYNRYYKQLDLLYGEIAKRMCNLNSTDCRAKEFQERCEKRGVPKECFGRIDKVEAVRVIGQGSAFMRKASVDALIPISGALPEDGRENLMRDKIAAEAGQSAVGRYWPEKSRRNMASEQEERAMNQVGDMKSGVPPVIASSQNAVTFAGVFISAAMQALQTVKQGANAVEVIKFLDLCGPAALAQLSRFSSDPSRQIVFKKMMEQWQKISEEADMLKKSVKQEAEQQGQLRQRQRQQLTDEQLAAQKLQSDIQLKTVKTQAQLAQSEQRHRLQMTHSVQDLEIKDATAAADISRKNAQSVDTGGE